MKTIKQIALSVFTTSLLIACGNKETSTDFTLKAKKRIYQKIDADAFGMIKDLKIEEVTKINDSVFKAMHTFTNPMIKKQMRITRNYTLNKGLDSVIKKEELKTEMKSQGEWIKAGF